ncbi:MAG: glyoxalase superfamily protein [Bacteroidota bacterium]
MATAIPIFRVFDRKKLVEFYIDWLGFSIAFEHNPPNAPFYMRVSIRDVYIDLTEHHGDCSPGAKISISDFEGLEAYHKSLSEKDFVYMNPGLERPEWDPETLNMTVIDPFFNRIIFTEKV